MLYLIELIGTDCHCNKCEERLIANNLKKVDEFVRLYKDCSYSLEAHELCFNKEGVLEKGKLLLEKHGEGLSSEELARREAAFRKTFLESECF